MKGSVYGSQALKVRPNPGPDPNPQSSAEPRTGPVRTVVHYLATTWLSWTRKLHAWNSLKSRLQNHRVYDLAQREHLLHNGIFNWPLSWWWNKGSCGSWDDSARFSLLLLHCFHTHHEVVAEATHDIKTAGVSTFNWYHISTFST